MCLSSVSIVSTQVSKSFWQFSSRQGSPTHQRMLEIVANQSSKIKVWFWRLMFDILPAIRPWKWGMWQKMCALPFTTRWQLKTWEPIKKKAPEWKAWHVGQVLLMVNSYDGYAGERLEGKKQFLKTSYSAPLVRGHGARLVGDKTFQKRHFL